MTFKEVLATGLPFKRNDWLEWHSNLTLLSWKDAIAEDWETKPPEPEKKKRKICLWKWEQSPYRSSIYGWSTRTSKDWYEKPLDPLEWTRVTGSERIIEVDE